MSVNLKKRHYDLVAQGRSDWHDVYETAARFKKESTHI